MAKAQQKRPSKIMNRTLSETIEILEKATAKSKSYSDTTLRNKKGQIGSQSGKSASTQDPRTVESGHYDAFPPGPSKNDGRAKRDYDDAKGDREQRARDKYRRDLKGSILRRTTGDGAITRAEATRRYNRQTTDSSQ